MMTLELPYEQVTNQYMLFQKIVKNIKPKPEKKLRYPKKFKQLIEKCWQKNPKKRPVSKQIIRYFETYESAITSFQPGK